MFTNIEDRLFAEMKLCIPMKVFLVYSKMMSFTGLYNFLDSPYYAHNRYALLEQSNNSKKEARYGLFCKVYKLRWLS